MLNRSLEKSGMHLRHLASILFIHALAFCAGTASADETFRVVNSGAPGPQVPLSSLSGVEHQIRTHDRRIFLELVKLAEFNVLYQQTVNHRARWRDVFYPLGQEAAYACYLGYSLTDISQRSRGWNDPGIISPTTTKRALSAAAVGALLGSTSSVVELTANGVEAVRAKQRGFSVRESVDFVQSTVNRVDDMLATRHALMQEVEFTGTRRELLELKEELLKYETDRLVFEFKRWSAHSRGYFWYSNAFYLINATVNMGRFSAVQLGLKSFTNPRCSGATGPVLIASACLAGVGPIASSTVGNCVQRYQKRLLSKKLPISPFLSDSEARQKFERLAQLLASNETNNQQGQLASELIRLRKEKIGLDTLIVHEDRKIERLRRVAGQQTITAPMISSLGVGSGILNTIGYYGYRQQPLINNKLGFAASATIIPAETVALIATPAAAMAAYRYERNLKRKGEHPEQLLSTRLEDLKTLEKLVSDAWR